MGYGMGVRKILAHVRAGDTKFYMMTVVVGVMLMIMMTVQNDNKCGMI